VRNAAGVDAKEAAAVEITRTGNETETRVPMDLRKALSAAPRAQISWADITPIARRDWILYVSSAKQPETRKRRIEKACDMLASGKRRICCFGGIPWLTKDLPTSGGTWRPLPKTTNRVPRRSTK
jgi:hypothetical protein